jgi:hypothetical protein
MVDHNGSRIGHGQRHHLVLRDVDNNSPEHHAYCRRADRYGVARRRTRASHESALHHSVASSAGRCDFVCIGRGVQSCRSVAGRPPNKRGEVGKAAQARVALRDRSIPRHGTQDHEPISSHRRSSSILPASYGRWRRHSTDTRWRSKVEPKKR